MIEYDRVQYWLLKSRGSIDLLTEQGVDRLFAYDVLRLLVALRYLHPCSSGSTRVDALTFTLTDIGAERLSELEQALGAGGNL